MEAESTAGGPNDRFEKRSFSSGFGGSLQSKTAEERLLRCEIEI